MANHQENLVSVIDADDVKRAREDDPVVTVEGNKITLVFPDVVTVEPGVALAELIQRWMNAEQMPMAATYDHGASVLTVRPHDATCPANWYDPCTCGSGAGDTA